MLNFLLKIKQHNTLFQWGVSKRRGKGMQLKSPTKLKQFLCLWIICTSGHLLKMFIRSNVQSSIQTVVISLVFYFFKAARPKSLWFSALWENLNSGLLITQFWALMQLWAIHKSSCITVLDWSNSRDTQHSFPMSRFILYSPFKGNSKCIH